MLNRHIQSRLKAYLRLFPVTLLSGARQTGKTTLTRLFMKQNNYFYVTLDDTFSLSNAKSDPTGWLSSLPKPLIIDEVQRAPELFLPIKKDVDEERVPGRYLLTGSANPLLLPKLGDSLAGRMGIATLYPFSQGELLETREEFLPWVFQESLSWKNFNDLSRENLITIIFKGGFPPIQIIKTAEDITLWMHAYIQTMLERDVRDIANIAGLIEFPRLFRLLATRAGSLLNIADVSRTLGMVTTTVHRYLQILEVLHFIHLLPPWFSNQAKRIIKSPKVQLCDTAVQAQLVYTDQKGLMNNPILFGQFFECFIYAELIKQKSWSSIPLELFHFRDGDYEVDFVLEQPNGTIVGIEAKSAEKVRQNDIKGLKHLQKIAQGKFHRGIVLYTGNKIERIEEDIWAVPVQALWEITNAT